VKPGAGKNKGSSFEIEICYTLTNWVTGKRKPAIFWRTASSGAQFTQTKGKGSKMAGDIMAVDPKGEFLIERFCIECKFYKEIPFDNILTGKSSILTWWDQVVEDARSVGRRPLLIFKANRRPAHLVAFPDVFSRLESYVGRGIGTFLLRDPSEGMSKEISLLDDFLGWVQPVDMKIF